MTENQGTTPKTDAELEAEQVERNQAAQDEANQANDAAAEGSSDQSDEDALNS